MKLTDEQAKAFYKTGAWVRCRELILIRDSYLCQICMKDNRPTPADTVHHIIHLKDDPSKALEESNLISVCRTCHGELHSTKANTSHSQAINVFEVKGNPEVF